ncbi:MAG: serine hydrolase [Rhizobiaceae bacterium]
MLEQRLDAAFRAGELPGLHSVLIIHRNRTLAECHFEDADERWGQPLGVRAHGPDTLHDLRSVTKSIVGLLYGVALAEGLVPGLDEPVIDHFPDYDDLATDPVRRTILVRHVLSMQMGTEWNEDLPYTSPANSEIAMEMAADRYRFALDRPITGTPGETWTYNGGATALIGRLIASGTGCSLDAYTAEKLFGPLDIEDFDWIKGSDGVASAASGLRLSIRDLSRIGRLILQGGRWNDKEVVPADWLEALSTPRIDLATGLRYGYFWWLAGRGNPPHWIAGFGNGGQRLTVSKPNDLIVAVFAGNYNDPEAWRVPVKILTEFAFPATSRS